MVTLLFSLAFSLDPTSFNLRAGKVVVDDLNLIRQGKSTFLVFTAVNHSQQNWYRFAVRFEVEASCGVRTLSFSTDADVDLPAGNSKTPGVLNYREPLKDLDPAIGDCKVERIEPVLTHAESFDWLVDPDHGIERDKKGERMRLSSKLKAERDRRDALRAKCKVLYSSTASKRVSDLTVAEEQDVRVCQALGMYTK